MADITDYKLLEFTEKVADLADRPALTPAQLKAAFDAAPEELKGKYNAMLDYLLANYPTNANITTDRKLSATGDFTGTLNGMDIVAAEPGFSSTVASHTAQLADLAAQVSNVVYANKDTQNLQTLITNANGKPVKLTRVYEINSPIVCPENVVLFTDSSSQGGIKAIAAMDAMLKFTNLRYSSITDINIDGNGLANNGILIDLVTEHTTIKGNHIQGTLQNAIRIHDGWCNDIINNRILLNTGNGINISLATSINIFNILSNKIFANDGIGLKIHGGSAINISFNTIEQNKKCGIFASAITGLRIVKNYFEGNSAVGVNGGIKTDIYLNGDSSEAYSILYPNTSVTISDNTTSCSGIAGFMFVKGNAVEKLTIADNNRYGVNEMNVLSLDSSIATSRGKSINLRNNYAFKPIEVTGSTLELMSDAHTLISDEAQTRNLVRSLDTISYPEVFSNGTVRATSTRKYLNETGVSLTQGSIGVGSVYRHSLTVDDLASMKNKYVVLTCTYYRENNSTIPLLYLNGENTNTFISGVENDFVELSCVTKITNETSLEVGYGTFSNASGGKVNIYNLALYELGGNYKMVK